MKRFLVFAVAAATMFSSCTKQYIDEVPTSGPSTIGFNTYVAPSTKGVAKTAFVMGDQFFVYGGSTGSTSFDFTNPNTAKWVFPGPSFGATVSNVGSDRWSYNDPISWTGLGNVTFFAFSPAPEAADDGEKYGIETKIPATTDIPSIDFTVKGGYAATGEITSEVDKLARAENKKQVDLLWACAANMQNTTPTVELNFRHALTKLNFSIKSTAPVGHMIRINTIVVKNVFTKASLALGHDETNKGDLDYLGGWSGHTAPLSFPVNLINSVAALINDNDVHAINDNDEALMMIPQALTGVELEVRYAYSADGFVWEQYEKGTPVTVKLGELTSHSFWNPNKALRYVLNITPGQVISFTTKLEEWGADGNIEIIHANPGKDATVLPDFNVQAGDKVSVSGEGDWITYDLNGTATPLTTTEITATGGEIFSVTANGTTAVRNNQIIIKKADGISQTIVKVSQAASNGTFEALVGAGPVTTLTLKTGDKLAVPQTKAAADWIKYKVGVDGAETAFEAEYIAAADEQFILLVTENTGDARSATVTYTPNGGTAFDYTINQAGVEAPEPKPEEDVALTPNAAGGQVLGSIVTGDIITLISGGGEWLTYTEKDGAPAELTKAGITSAVSGTIDVAINATTTERTATFKVENADKIVNYTLTQAAASPVTVKLAADGTSVPFALADGDKILANTAASDWLTLTSPDEPATVYNFAAEMVISAETAGKWAFTAAANDTEVALTETFTIVRADGNVQLYTVTQAGTTI